MTGAADCTRLLPAGPCSAYWRGDFGIYRVPDIILAIGQRANEAAGLPSNAHYVAAWPPAGGPTPLTENVAAWGVWRDAEELSARQNAIAARMVREADLMADLVIPRLSDYLKHRAMA